MLRCSFGPRSTAGDQLICHQTRVRHQGRRLSVPTADPRVIDLFAGAGGLSLGFVQEGFQIVGAVEFDADSAATYRMLHSHPGAVGTEPVKLHEQDICDVDFAQYRGELDAVIGGPPCQPWSLGGLRRGQSDPRDGIPQFARALHEAAPDAFVMENVAGLARGEDAADLRAGRGGARRRAAAIGTAGRPSEHRRQAFLRRLLEGPPCSQFRRAPEPPTPVHRGRPARPALHLARPDARTRLAHALRPCW